MSSHRQKELVQYLIFSRALRSPNIIEAFKYVDRGDFVRPEHIDEAYNDYPLPIGFEQTISQPSTVAFMLELLQPIHGNIVLDIGSGSGFTTTILAKIVGNDGYVIGLEILPDLVEYGKRNLQKYNPSNVIILQAGDELGVPNSTFDRILVSGSVDVFPSELLRQLRPGGRLVIPIADSVCLYKKNRSGSVQMEKYHGFRFVPLRINEHAD